MPRDGGVNRRWPVEMLGLDVCRRLRRRVWRLKNRRLPFRKEDAVPVALNGDLVSCPYCKRDVRLLRIHKAAILADVSRRTIYNYIDEGSVYAIKIAGKTLRVCPSCLLVEHSDVRRPATAGEVGKA